MNEQKAAPACAHSILLVDDEPGVCEVLKQVLEREQYHVVAVTDPLLALAELQRREFSVIISDLQMPDLSGLELLAEARRFRPYASRILITAVLSLDAVVDAVNKGEIFRFIVKPWLQEEFIAAVQSGVQRCELLRQNADLQTATQVMNEQLVDLNRSLAKQVKLVASQNEQLAKVNAALEQNLVRSLELCVHTMHTYYPALGDQIRRVAQICRAIGELLLLSKEERRVLESSAMLYDIGLLGVPRQVIRKWQEDPDSLNLGERALIGQHPIVGQELASFGSDLNQVREIIRAHHENYDGTGYPDQLVGEKIPWLARLLSVAVTFASSRLTLMDSLEKVKNEAGKSLDPNAVRVFLQAWTRSDISHEARTIALPDLRPGMVMARDIYAQNGVLLAPQGQQLDSASIKRMLEQNRTHPITQSLAVYC